MLRRVDGSNHESRTVAPSGVIAAAWLFFAVGAYLFVSAVLIQFGVVAFTTGAWLLGGMETMGPLVYVLAAVIAGAIGWGLLLVKGWARYLASVVAGLVFVFTIPTISSAVAYSQVFAIAREGLKIIVCVVLFRYLNTGDAAAAFAEREAETRLGL